jgi:hypothetical protein
MKSKYHFPRAELASQVAQMLTGSNLIGLSSDGLFIGGERRIGKTAFLINDLAPTLREQGYLVIYIDLTLVQSETTIHPIRQAFVTAKEEAKSQLKKTVKKITPAALSANVFGVGGGVNFAKQQENLSMLEAFYALHDATKKPIALIVDEAQRAMSTKAGQDALWALKSTRDQVKNNRESSAQLLLVFTGSNRAKLADMVTKKDQAFFGSTVIQMPYLGVDYIKDVCSNFNRAVPSANLDYKKTNQLFERLGKRPAVLWDAIQSCILSVEPMDTFNERVQIAVDQKKKDEEELVLVQIKNLPPLAQLVLKDIANEKESAPVFSTTNIKKYAAITKKKTLNTASIQAAIEVLINAELVWKSTRGVYQLEEPSYAAVIAKA